MFFPVIADLIFYFTGKLANFNDFQVSQIMQKLLLPRIRAEGTLCNVYY